MCVHCVENSYGAKWRWRHHCLLRLVAKLSSIWFKVTVILGDESKSIFTSVCLWFYYPLFQRGIQQSTHTQRILASSAGRVYSSLFLLRFLHVQIFRFTVLLELDSQYIIRKMQTCVFFSQRYQKRISKENSLFSLLLGKRVRAKQNAQFRNVWICYNWLIWVIYTRIPS